MKDSNTLQQLRSFNADSHDDLDELVLLYSNGKDLATTYKELDLDTPLWLSDALDAVKNEITRRNRDLLEKALREAEAEEVSLRSREERKDDVKERARKLREKLGKSTTTA